MVHSRALIGVVLVGSACVNSPPPPRQPTQAAEPEPNVVVEAEPPSSEAEPEPGIPTCDAYLALYESCEEYLKPEIMAGNRRSAHAERAWIEYIAGTPEVAALPSSCSSMLDALRTDCPEQHRRESE
jgi:hypothetical protein